MTGDSAKRIRRTRECRELAALLTGHPLSFAQWLVVSIPFLLSFHIPLNLISIFPCPAFTSPPLLLHLPAFMGSLPLLAFLHQSFPKQAKAQPVLFSQPSAPPLCVPCPFPTLCLSYLFRSQDLCDICFTVSAGDTQQCAFARRALGTPRRVLLPLKADSSSDGAQGCGSLCMLQSKVLGESLTLPAE